MPQTQLGQADRTHFLPGDQLLHRGKIFVGNPQTRARTFTTYLGWNITAEGFHAGKICNYAGGMIPFATTQAEREANGDPRLSLEERYGSHAGYVDAVRAAAADAVEQGYLLADDADAMIAQAEASNVLR